MRGVVFWVRESDIRTWSDAVLAVAVGIFGAVRPRC